MKKKSTSIKTKLSNGMEVEFRRNRVLGYTSQYQVRKFNSGVNSGIKLGDNVTIVPCNGDSVLVNNKRKMCTETYVYVYDAQRFFKV